MNSVEHIIYHSLSWTCVLASVVLKLPQLVAVVRAGSATGISTPGIMLEMWSFAAMLSYQYAQRFPMMQYVEYVFLMIQEIPLLLLVLRYNKSFNLSTFAYLAAFSAVNGAVMAGKTSVEFNALLVNINTPISAMSKIIQLASIIRAKTAGSVSVTTWSLAAYTCVARFITLLMEKPDMSLLLLYVVAGVLNVAIVFACLYYGPGAPVAPSKKDDDYNEDSVSTNANPPAPRRSPRKAE